LRRCGAARAHRSPEVALQREDTVASKKNALRRGAAQIIGQWDCNMAAAAPPLPAPLARPEDLANLAAQSVTVSDSGGSDNDLSFASFVSVASLEADIVDEGPHLQEPPPRPGPVTRERTGRAGPKRRYGESESSTDPAPPKKKPAREEPQRRGKWTAPEEAYANGIIDLFVAGKFPGCSGGESLRALLSKLLLCTPMRITKKFSRTRLIGKSSYKQVSDPSPEELATLEGVRRAFRRHADLPEESEGDREPVDAWVTTQGFDPSDVARGRSHSLCGFCLDPSQAPPAVTPQALFLPLLLTERGRASNDLGAEDPDAVAADLAALARLARTTYAAALCERHAARVLS